MRNSIKGNGCLLCVIYLGRRFTVMVIDIHMQKEKKRMKTTKIME